MKKDNTRFDYSQPLTYEQLHERKQAVLAQIRQQQGEIKRYTHAIIDGYTHPEELIAIKGISKLTGFIGGAFYAYKILRSISRITGILRKR